MIRSANDETKADAALWAVLQDVTERRIRGEDISDASVIADNPHLLPELPERLLALRRVESARHAASSSTGSLGDSANSFDEQTAVVDSFPGYQVREMVGRGACGVVYRAFHPVTRREVAIKAMVDRPFAGPNERFRFEREARILAQLKHPHIVAIHDTGWTHGRFYLVMDYVEGRPLDAFAEESKLGLRQMLTLFASVCDAVHAAHLRGIIHRDLKPKNILVDGDGEPRLLDFGLAKLSGDGDDPVMSVHSMTMTGQFIGSLPWASPEQAEGVPARIDLRTDIYSLGVILYQLLTSRFPYSIVGNIRDVIDRILTSEPEKPRRIRGEIDDEVETMVLKCLAKDRDRRYQSAGDLANDLRAYLRGETIAAKRDSTWYVFRKSLMRHRWAAVVAFGFLVVAVSYAVTVSLMYRREQTEAARAQRTLAFLDDTLFAASAQRMGAEATLAEVLDQAAERLSSEFEADPIAAAKLHYTIGSAYESIWRKPDGVRHLRKATELYRRHLGPENPKTLESAVYLGMVMAEDGDPNAEAILRNALAIRQRLYGDDHEWTAAAKDQLAFALWAAKSPPAYDESERLYRETLAVYDRTLGSDSTQSARMMTGWASMLRVQGKTDESLTMYRRALAILERVLSPDHQFVLEAKMGYADALQASGASAEAEAMLEPVLAHAVRRFGAPAIPFMMNRLATFKRSAGNVDGARKVLAQMLIYQCRDFAARRPEEEAAWRTVAESLGGEPSGYDFVSSYRAAVAAVYNRKKSAFDAVRSLSTFADIEFDAGRFETAVTLLTDAMPLVDYLPPSAIWRSGSVRARMGAAMLELDRPAEAEPLLTQGHAILERTVGAEHLETQDCARSLVRLYEALNRDADADRWRATVSNPTHKPD